MSGVNKVIIVGNLGDNPKMAHTSGGNAVANLSIATSENWKDSNGEKQERTEWHRTTLFGRLAEVAQQYLSKGSKVYVEGKLQTEKWQDKDGVERYTTKIIGNQMQMLDSKNDAKSNNASSAKGYANKNVQKSSSDNDFNDDIPF